MNELRERHTQSLKKALKDQKDEHDSQAAAPNSSPVKNLNSEAQLEKTQQLLNQRKAEADKANQLLEEERIKGEKNDTLLLQAQKQCEVYQKLIEDERTKSQLKNSNLESDKEKIRERNLPT